MSTTPTKILVTGNNYNVFKHDGIKNELPLGVYEINFSMTGPYLTKVDDIELPKKIYSNDKDFINHAMKSWESLDRGMLGIGLVGGKGLGKSLTCNLIAQKAGLPVIKLTKMVGSTDFVDYIKQLDQDFIFFIDEFEKIFPSKFDGDDGRASQEQLLSFLDGGTIKNNKIMFLITSNSKSDISDFLKNRPSRLRYFKEYVQLDEKVIREVIDDLLNNKEHLDDLLDTIPYTYINLDSLIKIIQEINLHDIPYSKFRDFFNFKATEYLNYDILLKHKDGTLEPLVSNFSRSLSSHNHVGYSSKLVEGRKIPVYTGPDFQVYENPKEPIEFSGYYPDKTQKVNEYGNYTEEDIILIVQPTSIMLKEKYGNAVDYVM